MSSPQVLSVLRKAARPSGAAAAIFAPATSEIFSGRAVALRAARQPASRSLHSANIRPVAVICHPQNGPRSTCKRTFASTAAARDNASKLDRTALHDFHVANGGNMVAFGGYSMPLSYSSATPLASHKHVRSAAGLFDVGHMVQHHFSGPGAGAFLELLTPSSLQSGLPEFGSTLSVLLNEQGGILDDTVITKQKDGKFYVVTNAGRRQEDLAWFRKQLEKWKAAGKPEVKHEVLSDHGLIALQGPQAALTLKKHVSGVDLSTLTFGRSAFATVAGIEGCHIARGGYTGEDGFEISIPSPSTTVAVTEALAADPAVELAGLAARDSLRLEAGMCLYGHDLDESVSPIEGALAWVVSKDRREKADFLGAERVLRELKDGPQRRRVGFVVEGPPAREGAQIYDEAGAEVIGRITSGIPSPTLGKNIAMGLIKNGHHKKDTKVQVEVRKSLRPAQVARMPFVPTKFYRGTQ